MKTTSVAAVLVFAGFAVVARAQSHGGGHGGGHAGGGHASGGGHSGGGGHAGGGHGGGGHSSSGHASGGGNRGGGSAVGARGHATGATGHSGRSSTGAFNARGTTTTGRSKSDAAGQTGDGVPPYSRPSRPRDPSAPIVGIAVPRMPENSATGTTALVPTGRPYGLRSYAFGTGLGAYGFGYYDPLYGGGPTFTQTVVAYDEGSLRLKITPRDAEVYVDGNYVGIVDDFDGIFQKLHISGGAHRIEVRAAGYETLVFDARISPDHKTTYGGELRRIQ
jgi:hypothetical protein